MITVSKNGNRIRATGSDANGLFIAFSSNDALLDWEQKKTGSEEFQKMVKEAIAARRLKPKEQTI